VDRSDRYVFTGNNWYGNFDSFLERKIKYPVICSEALPRGGRDEGTYPQGDGILMGMIAGIALTFGIFLFMFWPEKNPFFQADKTRADYLRERKDVIYENLRDLNFEYRAGKFLELDYEEQRQGLEDEAARVIAELEVLQARGDVGRRSRA